ncbi:uncharacterized protein TrAtP1_002309 [Trichoderma atroviride]|uniref:uncharacterized protein n=1 Tax=Hypocrea atroviridis TaxID=63577 RepID=UPI00332C7352|nr:hypothetical protein TrAtP1_002309 [Trichoderma atroviride]
MRYNGRRKLPLIIQAVEHGFAEFIQQPSKTNAVAWKNNGKQHFVSQYSSARLPLLNLYSHGFGLLVI